MSIPLLVIGRSIQSPQYQALFHLTSQSNGLERLFPTSDDGSPHRADPVPDRPASPATFGKPDASAARGLMTPRRARFEAEDDQAALLHMALTQSPACVSLQRGDAPASPLLDIPKLERQVTDTTPRLLGVSSPVHSRPSLLESPAVKAATQAAIAEAEAHVRRQQASPRRSGAALSSRATPSSQRAQRAAAAGVTAATRAAAAAAGILSAPRRVQSAAKAESPARANHAADTPAADDMFPFGTLYVAVVECVLFCSE